MKVKVMIPTPLRPYTENRDSVEVEGNTVGELLNALTQKYPQLKRHLFSEDGNLRSFVNIYVNDEDIRYLDGGNTGVKDGDVVSIVPAIAGEIKINMEVIEMTNAGVVELNREEFLSRINLFNPCVNTPGKVLNSRETKFS